MQPIIKEAPESNKMKTTKVDIYGHYDSDVSDTFLLRLPVSNITWKLTIDYLYFTLPADAPYTEPTAFLQMNSGMVTTACLHQSGNKTKGALLPIIKPYDGPSIRSTVYGIYGGPDDLRFAILDKNLQVVETERIALSFHLEEQK
jgi:hypothetical protein